MGDVAIIATHSGRKEKLPHFIVHLHLHEPLRLHPEGEKFLWDEVNIDKFISRGHRVYLPRVEILTRMMEENTSLKISIGISGIFLEQAEAYGREIIDALVSLFEKGKQMEQIELVDETYYHSFAGLFSDPEKKEFRDQVTLHREKLRTLFNVTPVTFAHPSLPLTPEIVLTVKDMGYKVAIGEGSHLFPGVYRLKDEEIFILLSRPGEKKERCKRGLISCELAGEDFEEYLLPIFEKGEIDFVLPSEVPRLYNLSDCAEWVEEREAAERVFSDPAGLALFKEIEEMGTRARKAGWDLLTRWRYLTQLDHLKYLTDLEAREHPYNGSAGHAAYILTRKVENLRMSLMRFEVLKRAERTAVLIISPETGRLPEGMGKLARFISGKSGGQGEVVSALCEGLLERGIHVHLATLNLKKRFQQESQIDEEEWKAIRYNIPAERIHLVSSAIFANKMHAYEGDPIPTAAEFQRQIVNYIIKDVRARHEGRLIIHSHDWMAGGAITAYARATNLPVLHTVHNVFTAHIPLNIMEGIDLNQLYENLFITIEGGRLCLDCQATAIKNATLINFVGERFLEEIVNDYFWDRPIIPPSVRQEVKVKYYNDAVRTVINAPSPTMYPENCPFLVKKFGPDDDILESKRQNLIAFQRKTGLVEDPQAILFFWPSRLDPSQKGVELLEAVAQPFCSAHPEVQIAIVADGVGNDEYHKEILGRIAYSSKGRIVYYPFSESLSMLGYGAAHDVFGASLYEPCGQIDQIANLFGATATNRDTGGYHDKITELQLKIDGAPQDMGNGFLFRDYDTGGLWYGLEKSLAFHLRPPEVREPQLRRIMKEARIRYDLNSMIAAYIRIYEWLNGNKPLI